MNYDYGIHYFKLIEFLLIFSFPSLSLQSLYLFAQNWKVINYGSPRGIKVHTEKAKQTVSKLMIQKAQINDSGNYSCTPSNAEAAHIAVHIQNNANPAASIQHGKRSARYIQFDWFLFRSRFHSLSM